MTTPETLLTDRVAPHDLGTERAILGAALSDVRIAERLATRLRPEDFFQDSHQRLFKMMSDLLEAGRGVDIGLIAAAGRQAGLEQPVLDTIPQMIEEAATTALLDDYLRVILERSARRDMIRLAAEAIGRAYDGAGTATSLAGDLGEALQRVAARADRPRRPMSHLAWPRSTLSTSWRAGSARASSQRRSCGSTSSSAAACSRANWYSWAAAPAWPRAPSPSSGWR
jgi:replicative DNA helicase